MKWFLLFFVANLLDAGMTHYLVATGFPVEEVGPLSGPILAKYGWGGMWAFKLFAPCAIFWIIHIWRKKKSRDEIMMVSGIAFMIVVLYSATLMFVYKDWAS